jgi:hypothetical protein
MGSSTHEAADMVTAGQIVVARELMVWRDGELMRNLRPTLLRRINDQTWGMFYEIVDFREDPGGEVTQYRDPMQAARSLRERVGGAALSRAVSELRYSHLFPSGSSLEWQAQPIAIEPAAAAVAARRVA